MPITTGIPASSRATLSNKIKRCVIVAAIAVAAIVALDQLGLTPSSLAQKAWRGVHRVDQEIGRASCRERV